MGPNLDADSEPSLEEAVASGQRQWTRRDEITRIDVALLTFDAGLAVGVEMLEWPKPILPTDCIR